MILKGEKIYLKNSLREGDYLAILKGYTDLSIIGFVYFAKEEVTKIMIEYVLRELKFEKITLTVSDLHKKAIALYEKMGFKKKQLVLNDRDVFLDNKWIRSGTIEMEKLC